MWERQRANPVQFLQTPEFVRFPRSIKLRNGIYNGDLKMRGRICCSCLWFRRSPGPFCETRDPGPREMQIHTMRCWDEGVHCWNETSVCSILSLSPHLLNIFQDSAVSLPLSHVTAFGPNDPPHCSDQQSGDAVMWWQMICSVTDHPEKFLPSAYIKRHGSTLSIYFPFCRWSLYTYRQFKRARCEPCHEIMCRGFMQTEDKCWLRK